MGCGAGMRILTGAGAVAVMGPAVLSSHNKGTLLFHDTIHMSQQNTYVTKHHTCHSTTHMSQRNTHATAQYICHSTTNMSQSKQSMHYNTQTTKYAARGLAQHVCGTSLQHAQVPSHSIAAQYRYAYGKLCMSQEAMKAVLLMIIDGCKKPMTACCSSKLLLHC